MPETVPKVKGTDRGIYLTKQIRSLEALSNTSDLLEGTCYDPRRLRERGGYGVQRLFKADFSLRFI